MKLQGKVAIVTGATKGIGIGCAEEMLKEGAKVVLTGRSVELGEEAAKRISIMEGDTLFVACDVKDSSQVKNLKWPSISTIPMSGSSTCRAFTSRVASTVRMTTTSPGTCPARCGSTWSRRRAS